MPPSRADRGRFADSFFTRERIAEPAGAGSREHVRFADSFFTKERSPESRRRHACGPASARNALRRAEYRRSGLAGTLCYAPARRRTDGGFNARPQ